MEQNEIERCRKLAEHAASLGGDTLLKHLGRITAREKGPKDLVTEADVESQRLIRQAILAEFPNHRFVGEESTEDDHPVDLAAAIADGPPVWIVDPLDGTMNFVHAMPPFGVSIAVAERGRVLAGVVLDPFYRECFSAAAGLGATMNGVSIRVSDCSRLGDALLAASFSPRVDRDSAEIRRFVEGMIHAQGIRRLGSAALNLCYVAAGRLDGYWATSVKSWDVAAGSLIVHEAGGLMSHIDGGEFSLTDPRLIAAATRELHVEMSERLVFDSDSKPDGRLSN